jgi:hypothetical protein
LRCGKIDPCGRWRGSARAGITEQDCHSARAIHPALNQQGVRLFEKLRVMLEVLAGGLHGVDHMRR